MDTEIIEKLLEKLINEQKATFTELTNLINKKQAELLEGKNKGGDTQAVEELKELINRQSSNIESLKNKKTVVDLSEYIESDKGRSITIFGGNEAHITYKWALMFLGFCFLVFCGFKYIPSYLVESKKIEKNVHRNNHFVQYLRLKEFKEQGNTKNIDTFLNKVSNDDSLFVEEYNNLINHYNSEIDRIETEETIKELQNKLEETKK